MDGNDFPSSPQHQDLKKRLSAKLCANRGRFEPLRSVVARKVLKDGQLALQGAAPSHVRLHELFQVSQNVSVARLKGLPLLVGSFPSVKPKAVKIASSMPSIEVAVKHAAVKRGLLTAESTMPTPKVRKLSNAMDAAGGNGKIVKKRRTAPVVGRVSVLIHNLLADLRDTMACDIAHDREIVLSDRFKGQDFGEGGRAAVIFITPIDNSSMRTFGILIELPRDAAQWHHCIGCVRFVADPALAPGRRLNIEDIISYCSCSGIAPQTPCAHIDIVYEDPRVTELVHEVLTATSARRTAPSADESVTWRCVPVGVRNENKKNIWLTIRNGTESIQHLQDDVVPVVELRESAQLSSNLRYRLRCAQCPRSAKNRGLCDHESAILWASNVEESDECGSDGQENDDDDVESDEDENEIADDSTTPYIDPALAKRSEQFNKYIAVLPRRFTPCKSDKEAIKNVLLHASRVVHGRLVNGEPDLTDTRPVFRACDFERACPSCSAVLHLNQDVQICTAELREVTYHTLVHGSLDIEVVDY